MEKSEIQNKIKTIKDLTDFVRLLNEIKSDEFGKSSSKITKGQLLHYSYYKIVPNRYRTFHIKKKSGGLREINAPCRELSTLLYLLNILFKALYTPGSSVMGFAEGRSVVMNASMHTGHHYVFNIDLENFFPSIPQGRVWARLQLPPFKFPVEVAKVVAGLCCHINEEGTQCVLPQGAPTSPLLTNAICDKLDRRMHGVARKFGLHYSRYADDMTFSSMHNVYQEGSDFRKEIKRIIEDQGFKMNDKKTRLLRDGQRQEVTGLTVNENVNLTRKYIRDIRCILHVWEKEGYEKAYAYFYAIYKKEKGYIKKGEPIMENVIGGKLNYMRMVKGERNAAYKKLLARFNKLQDVAFVDTETEPNKSFVYVSSYSMKEFKEYFRTPISMEISDNNNLVVKCQIGGKDKSLSVSKSTQKALCPNLDQLNPGDCVKSPLLDNCFVSLCVSMGKNFWLVTTSEMKRSRCFNILNANIDIDRLLDVWEKEGINKAAILFKEFITSKDKSALKIGENNPNTIIRNTARGYFDDDSLSDDIISQISKIDLESLIDEIGPGIEIDWDSEINDSPSTENKKVVPKDYIDLADKILET